MALTVEQLRARDAARRAAGLPPGPEPSASDAVDLFVRADWRAAEDGDAIVWDDDARLWVPLPVAAQSGSGSGSILFTQADAALTSSFAWRAPSAAHYGSATLTVADAVVDDVDVVEIAVNGDTVATLSLDDGETTSTASIDVDLVEGDRLAVARIAVDGGACQVQLDPGA